MDIDQHLILRQNMEICRYIIELIDTHEKNCYQYSIRGLITNGDIKVMIQLKTRNAHNITSTIVAKVKSVDNPSEVTCYSQS